MRVKKKSWKKLLNDGGKKKSGAKNLKVEKKVG